MHDASSSRRPPSRASRRKLDAAIGRRVGIGLIARGCGVDVRCADGEQDPTEALAGGHQAASSVIAITKASAVHGRSQDEKSSGACWEFLFHAGIIGDRAN